MPQLKRHDHRACRSRTIGFDSSPRCPLEGLEDEFRILHFDIHRHFPRNYADP